MTNPHNLEVGQRLFMVSTLNRSRHGRNDSWETIRKVGRKWATLEGYEKYRVSLEFLSVDGGEYVSPAQCYLTEKEYREKVCKQKCWGKIQQRLRGMFQSPDCSIEYMMMVADILGLDIDDE